MNIKKPKMKLTKFRVIGIICLVIMVAIAAYFIVHKNVEKRSIEQSACPSGGYSGSDIPLECG